jgi:hypothetical protein
LTRSDEAEGNVVLNRFLQLREALSIVLIAGQTMTGLSAMRKEFSHSSELKYV